MCKASNANFLLQFLNLLRKEYWNYIDTITEAAWFFVENTIRAMESMDLYNSGIFLMPCAIILFLLWFFFFNDRDCCLALSERFGRGVSKFSGKVVWVTGALSGLGEQMAYQLAAVGAKLIISGRNMEMLDNLKNECIEISRGKLTKTDILPLAVNIALAEESTMTRAVSFFGKIDVLILNSAHARIEPSVHVDLDQDRALFEVNYFRGTQLAKLLMRHFLEKDEGQILVVGSIAAIIGIPGIASYSASEHALLGFFNSLRYDYGHRKIPITVVCPGLHETTISDRACLFGDDRIAMAKEEEEKYARHGMKTKRCARLALIAAANQLKEGWMACQPFLCWMVLAQYFPTFQKCLMKVIFHSTRLDDIYAGKWPRILTWRPLFPI